MEDSDPQDGDLSDSDQYYADLHRRLESETESESDRAGTTADVELPERIGRYRVLGILGEGGQGITYRAYHPDLEREVVLKVGHGSRHAERELFDQLRDEARLLAQVEHPHTARVHDIDVADGRPFIVLEYVRGPSLEQANAAKLWDDQRKARTVASIARACHAAHALGVVHRDIKPANIVLDDEHKTAKLIDFGIARLRDVWSSEEADPRIVTGTLEYMAPEQARGDVDRIGPCSDVFALGGVLFFLITGKAPIRAQSIGEALQLAREGRFARDDLDASAAPAELRRICARALSKEPEERHASAIALAEELESFASVRPRRWLQPLIASAALALIAWLCFVLFATPPPSFEGARFDISISADDTPAVTLEHSVPVPTHAGVLIELSLEAQTAKLASAFWLDSSGDLHPVELSEREASTSGHTLLTTAREIVGQTGSEFVFVCVNSDGPPTIDEVRTALGDLVQAWPAMAPRTCIRILHSEVQLLGLRAPGAIRAPPESALGKARSARARLAEAFTWNAGWVFPHVRPAD